MKRSVHMRYGDNAVRETLAAARPAETTGGSLAVSAVGESPAPSPPDPHPWYPGGCDKLGPDGACSECTYRAAAEEQDRQAMTSGLAAVFATDTGVAALSDPAVQRAAEQRTLQSRLPLLRNAEHTALTRDVVARTDGRR